MTSEDALARFHFSPGICGPEVSRVRCQALRVANVQRAIVPWGIVVRVVRLCLLLPDMGSIGFGWGMCCLGGGKAGSRWCVGAGVLARLVPSLSGDYELVVLLGGRVQVCLVF